MNTIKINKDLVVFYVEAESFPEGIMKAMKTLHSKVSDSSKRITYGISRPEANGMIMYKAALKEQFEGEGKRYDCDTLVLKKGVYSFTVVKNYIKHVEAISEAFQNIMALPGLDPQGYCVEVYENETDVTCMVRMAD